MRVAHCVGWYLPQSVGGSELYVRNLCAHLEASGVECTVLTPRRPAAPAAYVHAGVRVLPYPAAELPAFEALLREVQADVFHLHSFTLGAGLPQLECARRLGLRTLTTVHVPAPLCMRGTLMHMGTEACDGRIQTRRCTACWAQGRGLAEPVAKLLSVVAPRLPPLPLPGAGRLVTALSAPALVAQQAERLRRLVDASDAVVAVAAWLAAALRGNGVSESKLHLCRQGVDRPADGFAPRPAPARTGELSLAYVGRWDPVKGADVVARAVLGLPAHVPVTLTMYGTGSGPEADAHRAALGRLCARDPRLILAGPIAPDSVMPTLRAHDALVVPSVWLETGPLVAMEALVAGVPVLGSDLGGLRELIKDGENGWLVKAGDPKAWGEAIARLARDGLPAELDRSGSVVQSMAAVAARMRTLYEAPSPTSPRTGTP